MNKIIQICGCNGSGKSTAMKSFIKTGDFFEAYIELKRKYKILANKDKSIIILGDYKETVTCGGCDALKISSDELISVLDFIISKFSPKIILFEGVMLGKTFTLGKRIYLFSKKNKYDYTRLTFFCDFKILHERILKRNKGNEINVELLYKTYRDIFSSSKRLKENGVTVKMINTQNFHLEEYATLIEKEIKK